MQITEARPRIFERAHMDTELSTMRNLCLLEHSEQLFFELLQDSVVRPRLIADQSALNGK